MLKARCPVIYLSNFHKQETNDLLRDIKRWEVQKALFPKPGSLEADKEESELDYEIKENKKL